MATSYLPPNFINKDGTDNYESLTGVATSDEEKKYRNPVVYARAKYEQYKREQLSKK